jgi:hypothetical protein
MPAYRTKFLHNVADQVMRWYSDLLEKREDITQDMLLDYIEKFSSLDDYDSAEWQRLIHSIENRMERHVTNFYQELLRVRHDHPDSLEVDIAWDVPLERVRKRMLEKIKSWSQDPKYKLREMERLARDSQNIHTGPVNALANQTFAKLSTVKISEEQRTLPAIYSAWHTLGLPEEVILPVYVDMKKWGNTRSVVKTNDYLYRNTLRSVWAKILTYKGETRYELIKRLWEECYEAKDMCAQGHLSRLANVFVGFDLDMKPPVSRTTFQDSIAAVARSADSLSEKMEKAKALMDEYEIPQDERQPWLDAMDG